MTDGRPTDDPRPPQPAEAWRRFAIPQRFIMPEHASSEKRLGRYVWRVPNEIVHCSIHPTRLINVIRRGAELLSRPLAATGAAPAWWIGVGTALGLVREGGLLRGDTDVDARVGIEYTTNADAASIAFELAERFAAAGFRIVRESWFDARPMQICFADTTQNNALFDIYFFYLGISEGRAVNVNEWNMRRKPRHFIDNRTLVPWPDHPDISVYLPQPADDYLAWRFGPEWRIPKTLAQFGPVDTAALEPLPQVTVLTYGTWDLFHHGHRNLLERAAALGDHLVVGVVSDALLEVKGKTHLEDEATRAAAVRALPFVREVFIQRQLDQKEFDIERFGAAHLVVGDDWANHPRFEQVRSYRGVSLHYLPRTPGISSTQLRANRSNGSGV